MVTYDRLDDLPDRIRGRVEASLADEEKFVMGARSPGLLKRWLPYFIVTDQRFIRYQKRGFIEEFDTIRVGQLTQVGFDGTGVGGTVELEGHGVNEEHALGGGSARQLADSLRAQLTHETT